jgi:hypothetical protein
MYISANYSREGTGVADPGDGGMPGEDPGDDGPGEETPPPDDPEVDQDVKNEEVPTFPDDPPPVEPAPEAPVT